VAFTPGSVDSCSFASLAARLERLAGKYHVPRSERADCVQDAFRILIAKHPEWPLIDDLTEAWLAGVVRLKAYGLVRQQRNRSCICFEELPLLVGGRTTRCLPEKSPLPLLLSKEIKTATLKLSPVSRRVFIMRARDELGYEEIAERVGLTADQARARYLWALRKVRRLLSAGMGCPSGDEGKLKRNSPVHNGSETGDGCSAVGQQGETDGYDCDVG
jgi:RNA polymerase sigma factor (sigma-70 family)